MVYEQHIRMASEDHVTVHIVSKQCSLILAINR